MPSPIIPPALKPGATIAFVSPSSRINNELPAAISRAIALLSAKGYCVRELFTLDTDIQSSIANRRSELRTAFSDPSISAIICTTGGPSLTELLPGLLADTELHATIRAYPKVFVGYSDITVLHWFLHAVTGLRTFYGPGAVPELCESPLKDQGAYEASPLTFCVKHLFRAITDPQPIGSISRSLTYAPDPALVYSDPNSISPPRLLPNPGWTWLRPGKSQGRIFGGCLTVMARLAGIPAIVPDWRGRIVFFETALNDDFLSGNPLYRVRAGIADLIAQNVFDQCAGLVVGRPFGYDSEAMRKEYIGVIMELLCEGPMKGGFPILFGVDFGHTTPMVTLPMDALVELDSERDSFRVVEGGVCS
jgi:muramoyltetrapeptide carboxypeptidase LdcA involved in peptidoglycan recycling